MCQPLVLTLWFVLSADCLDWWRIALLPLASITVLHACAKKFILPLAPKLPPFSQEPGWNFPMSTFFFFFFPSLFLFFPCLSLAAVYWWITKYLFLVVVLKNQERCRKRQLPPNSATSLQTKISFSLCSFPRKSFVSIAWKQLFPRCTVTDPTNKYCDAKKHPYQTSVHMPSDRVCYLCSKWRWCD